MEDMGFEAIRPDEIDKYLFREGCTVVDLREPREFRRLHLKGAVCIPYNEILSKARFLKNRTLVLYCEHGGASMKAARELGERGYRVKSMIGGIRAYRGGNTESFIEGKNK